MTTEMVPAYQLEVTSEQRTLIKKTLAPEATDVELELFFYDNRRRGVHPLDRLIHFTKRNGRYVPITSIHFMRGKADDGGRAGQEPPVYAGKEAMPDYTCSVTVYKNVDGVRVSYVGIARWKEYYPSEPKEGFMWRKMPSHMIAKCAEANALRLGFPRELAGLHIEEEVHVLDEPTSIQHSEPAPTLKEKLKAQVEQSAQPSAVLESSTEEVLEEIKQQYPSILNQPAPPIGTDAQFHELLEKFNLVEYIKAWADLKNDSLFYQWTPEQSKTLNDRSGLALKRLKDGERKKK